MPIFSDAEKAEFLAASPANQQAAIAANGLTAADLAQNFNIPVTVADQWATNNGINFATPAAPIQSPFVQQPAAITAATNAAVAQANASPGIGVATTPAAGTPDPSAIFKHDFKVDQGGTLTIDGKPLTDAQNAESTTPGTVPWAASFMTNPKYAPLVPLVKDQLAKTGSISPQLAEQIGQSGYTGPGEAGFWKDFASKAITVAGVVAGGGGVLSALGVEAPIAEGAAALAGGTVPPASYWDMVAGSTSGTGIGASAGAAAGNTATGIFGTGVGAGMTAGQIAFAEKVIAGAGIAAVQQFLKGGSTATQILGSIAASAAFSSLPKGTSGATGGNDALKASAANQSQDWLNTTGKEVNTANPAYLNNGDPNPNYQGNNIFNGVTDFGQHTITGADGTKINSDGVTTGNVTGGDLSNFGTQVNVADASKLNNGQPNPNWTDQFSTLPSGMQPWGKEVNLSNSKVLNDGTPNPAYTTTGGTNTGTGTGTGTGSGSGTGTGAGTGGLNLGAAAIPLALGAATGALSLMKPEVQTKTTAAMSPEEQQLIALNTELTQKQLGNVNAATGLQGQANTAAGQALATTQANDAAVSGALSPQELATQAQQQYDRAQAAGANSDTLQAINTQIAQSGGAPTAEQVARIKAAADAAITAGSGDINMQLQRGIGVIADEQANQRGLRFSTDTPILREGTLLARSAQDNIANLSAGIRAGEANNMLSYPLQANASTSGVASNQQQINQAAQQFQADLMQKAQANRLALTGQASQGGIGLAGVGGSPAAISATAGDRTTTTTTTPGIGLTQIGQLASGVGGLVTALNAP